MGKHFTNSFFLLAWRVNWAMVNQETKDKNESFHSPAARDTSWEFLVIETSPDRWTRQKGISSPRDTGSCTRSLRRTGHMTVGPDTSVGWFRGRHSSNMSESGCGTAWSVPTVEMKVIFRLGIICAWLKWFYNLCQ